MPFIIRANERARTELTAGITSEVVLSPADLPDSRLTVEVLTLEPSAHVTMNTGNTELAWLQVLDGDISIDGIPTDRFIVTMWARGATLNVTADSRAEVLVCRVPHAIDYDPDLVQDAVRRIDWSTEPVLNSEHDSRQRIYLASTGLWGTEAVKGEMIIYPPGAAGAEHHHEGAEHFQFMISGSGTAVLSGEEVTLHEGDFLYNFENEMHSFYNGSDSDMVFVEFFVPGHSKTVWPPEVNVCGWQPTGIDIKGRTAARELSYHVHGQGDV
jgi:quercetin dioxygenase-like cupin family protein